MTVATGPPPLAIPALLRRAFAAYRARFVLFLAATTVSQLPTALPALLVGYGASATLDRLLATKLPEVHTVEEVIAGWLSLGGGWLVGYGLLLVASSLLSVIGQVLSASALTYLLAVEPGPPDPLGAAYRTVLRRLGPLFGAILLAGFIICGVLLLVLVILVFLTAVEFMLRPAGEAPPAGVQAVVLLLLFALVFGGLGYALYAIVRWALFIPAVVLENAGPADALRRSAALLRRQWWRTAGLLTLLALGQIILGILASAVLGGLLAGWTDGAIAGLAGGLAWTLANLVYFPLAANALTLFYLALRARERPATTS
jgi:hypothetical protein